MDDDAIAILRAVARATERLTEAQVPGAPFGFHHLSVGESEEGLFIAGMLVVGREDGLQVDRTLTAGNRLDGKGWFVSRRVTLGSGMPGDTEPAAATDMPAAAFPTSGELAAAFDGLLDELLEAPVPAT